MNKQLMHLIDQGFALFGEEYTSSNFIFLLILIVARFSPFVWLVPWLGLRFIPSMIRIGIVVALSLALMPPALQKSTFVFQSYPLFFSQLFFEILFGIFLGLMLSLPIYALGWAGMLADQWGRPGFSGASMDVEGNPSSPMGTFSSLLGIFIFLSLDGHLATFELLSKSLSTVQPGSFLPFSMPEILFESIMHFFSWSFELSLRIVIPVIILTLFVDLVLGWMSKASQSFSVFFLQLPLKSLISLSVFFIIVLGWGDFLPLQFKDGLQFFEQVLNQF